MELLLTRDIKTIDFTLGTLYIDGTEFCKTVEDMERMEGEKVFGKTAIPKGEYKVIINHSNHFNKSLPLLLDVPNFEGIRIHSGNSAADSEGCIILGMTRTINGVAMSRIAMDKFMSKINNQTIKIIIR